MPRAPGKLPSIQPGQRSDDSHWPERWLFHGDPDERLSFLTDMMRAISTVEDPQELVNAYHSRLNQKFPVDGHVGLSRRDCEQPGYRVTRSHRWTADFNPWTSREHTPCYTKGLLGRLIYEEKPVILDDLQAELDADDPARWALEGMGSLCAIPMFDHGRALNMTILLRREKRAFDYHSFPLHVWTANLFGRATTNLVRRTALDETKQQLEAELQAVGDIQQTLLPESVPEHVGLKIATYYSPSAQASGDYYDFFKLPGDRLGIFVGDVSGHGTPAAVLMAVTHALVHSMEEPPHADPPGRVLKHVNRMLCQQYTKKGGMFITAFYGVYNPKDRTITYASAGHLPPRIKHDWSRPRADGCEGQVCRLLDGVKSLPLGISYDEEYAQTTEVLDPGDVITIFTDGITETRNPSGQLWTNDGLDEVLMRCSCDPQSLVRQVVEAVDEYAHHAPPDDDRTLVVAKLDS